MTTPGRRREPLSEDNIHSDVQRGDYWRVLSGDSGEPLVSPDPGNLTRGVWFVAAPIGDAEGFALAMLTRHTVREEDDGTISVRAGDGGSNSILITRGAGAGGRYHGYIEHGVWSENL